MEQLPSLTRILLELLLVPSLGPRCLIPVQTTRLWPLEGDVLPRKLRPRFCSTGSLGWSLGGWDDDNDRFLVFLVTPGSRVAKITCNYNCILINDLCFLLGILGIIFPSISWRSTQLDILLHVFYYCIWIMLLRFLPKVAREVEDSRRSPSYCFSFFPPPPPCPHLFHVSVRPLFLWGLAGGSWKEPFDADKCVL